METVTAVLLFMIVLILFLVLVWWLVKREFATELKFFEFLRNPLKYVGVGN